MPGSSFHRLVALALLLPILTLVQGCKGLSSVETVSVSLRNTETYEYPTVGGDEEGARISSQAGHYRISEIRRNVATNWVAVYVYQAAPGFVGSDSAEIEILTGSDGASAPTNIKKVVFRFIIHN